MTVDPFTDEEHEARAILMGPLWTYRAERGYYFRMINGTHERLDAITLEPISLEEKERRQFRENPEERYYKNG